jgi:hypothetical protein
MSKNELRKALVAAGLVGAGAAAFAEEATPTAITALTPTTINGYVDTSAIWLFDEQNGGARLPGRSFDGPGKQDGFNLNVVKVGLEKALDESAWSAGYKVDLLFGPDAVGWNTAINTGDLGDFGIRQAYVALRADIGNGLDFKIGTFDTIIGYEVFEAGGNPNYSRSYGYFIEPTQHTGVLASYSLTEWLAVTAGVANTYSPRINARPAEDGAPADDGRKAYMGSVTVTAPESAGWLAGAALYAGIVGGLGFDGGDSDDKVNLYVGGSMPTPLTGLTVGIAYDYRHQELGGMETWSGALGGYAIYQINDKLKLSGRAEIAKGTDGSWGTAIGDGQEEFFGLTATLDYSLWANVISRLEFRWDNDLAGNDSFGSTAEPEENAVSLALNIIYRF